ncbi:MAG: cysteine--tRNA ligase [Candidatus Staskawiczbacteria bacterium RIFOXYB2_FULL_32_9]|uniref:Cysteine--tRNA ligase n=1 Tax=Candidatus Staskawiczbacteria bacterium RIFOXYD1_FULL_32_13 TaxID=1802234 RepID=A0A1G2JQT7_9BACT|nr:MAG: Cysteinyl-tRNA ligase [Parcubacteria group bacterium GW2011_GWC2_32_10]OGZ84810.1 MAG: cysteine--tRNA ligase [Candidatus Staskawiczbacteria bacterium RIFOXYB2_FULL_32_9]OGZ85516.1 MAG: cysteine--tRNA ligase [Candidatus Staskawiczbacteria bacterium RIFOXYC2_FULL_32_10]OGZ88650.1 MAG: cysteine--tRNA ligase [Candidatus Staskawiczbacteria bacterium RIFOXYD1_FULL_32_13]
MKKIKHQIKIYNTLTKKKDLIKPIKAKKINLFVCGPTVYDFSHLGHARAYITFDAIVKYLRFSDFKVFYLQNITNIDDKIIQRAREKGVPALDLARAYEKEYLKDMKFLGVNAVTKYARATNYIKDIISQVQRLEKRGFAYKIDNDGIYFDIVKFKGYGKLSGRTVSGAQDATSRIDYSVQKRNRGDFCLWKFTQIEGEPKWKSPWGSGRPGWHIEDTAISEKFFGAQYDIHGGAIDLIFPHHEAEVTQMEAISGKSPLVKYWIHVGFLTINGQKMSKSLGNFTTISNFSKRYSKEQIRFLILKSLWSSPLDYSESVMVEVKVALEKIEEFLRKLQITNYKSQINNKSQILNSKRIKKILEKAKIDFYRQLDDNFNTPKAFAVLFDFIKEINSLLSLQGGSLVMMERQAKEIYEFFVEINNIFGIIDFSKIKKRSVSVDIKKLVEEREDARKNKDWQKSDELRQKIAELGFIIKDTSSGAVLEKK